MRPLVPTRPEKRSPGYSRGSPSLAAAALGDYRFDTPNNKSERFRHADTKGTLWADAKLVTARCLRADTASILKRSHGFVGWVPVTCMKCVIALSAVVLGGACGVDVPATVPSALPTQPTPSSSPSPPPPPPRPAIPLPPGSPPSVTTLTFTSESGDYIGQGLSRTYYLGDGTWNARYDNTRGHVNVSVTNFSVSDGWSWYLDLAAPRGQQLTNGVYEGARRYPFQPETQPGLSFSGTGRGCNTLTGRFVVSDISIGPDNTVQRLTAAFDQNCEGASPTLRGRIVIASEPWR